MTTEISASMFVKPYFIEELGCLGLSVSDIAKSIGADASSLRRKLADRGYLDRINTQGFQALPVVRVNTINGLSYTEYVLDVSASKFLAAKYDSAQGDAYLAFLINLESAVNELDAFTRNDPLLQQIAATQRIRLQQLKQEERILALEERTEDIHETILDSILTAVQKTHLKSLIDSKAYTKGDIRFAGAIQKRLKELFQLNTTNDKWYHIKQRDYQKACNFVSGWGIG